MSRGILISYLEMAGKTIFNNLIHRTVRESLACYRVDPIHVAYTILWRADRGERHIMRIVTQEKKQFYVLSVRDLLPQEGGGGKCGVVHVRGLIYRMS